MTAAELIGKLKRLDPDEVILVAEEGCHCCELREEGPGVLVRHEGRILFVHKEVLGP